MSHQDTTAPMSGRVLAGVNISPNNAEASVSYLPDRDCFDLDFGDFYLSLTREQWNILVEAVNRVAPAVLA